MSHLRQLPPTTKPTLFVLAPSSRLFFDRSFLCTWSSRHLGGGFDQPIRTGQNYCGREKLIPLLTRKNGQGPHPLYYCCFFFTSPLSNDIVPSDVGAWLEVRSVMGRS